MNTVAKKSLGQHWLDDKQTLSAICELADIKKAEKVLEIGPGHGSLTEMLLQSGAKVTAVELDKELAKNLIAKNFENLRVINQDILEFDLTSLPQGYKVVANIPYYLTSNLIRNLSESTNPPASITLLVQKEVAQRICAKPGGMSVLSVSAQVYHDCTLGLIVPAEKFIPPPKVDSQVVHMARKLKPLVDNQSKKQFFHVVKAGFAGRRKTLPNSLSAGLHLPKEEVAEILRRVNIDTNTRAQQLSIDDWLKLNKYLTR